MKYSIYLSILMILTSCSQSPVHERPSAGVPDQSEIVYAPEYDMEERHSQIRDEISALESQIFSLDSMIMSTESRIVNGMELNQGSTGAQTQISSYESQKADLQARIAGLQSELNTL